jgi:hypothetical protein
MIAFAPTLAPAPKRLIQPGKKRGSDRDDGEEEEEDETGVDT